MSKTVAVVTEKPFAKSAISGIEEILRNSENIKFNFKIIEKYNSLNQLFDFLKSENPDAVIIRSDLANRDFFSACGSNLRIVVRAGAGVDNIDLTAATEAGIVAMNTPGQNSNAVAELAFGMMIYHARSKFSGEAGYELRGKTLALHGCGNIGRYMCKIATGFGMQVIAYDPFLSSEDITQCGAIPAASVADLFKNGDFISLHIPATNETKNSINKELFESMKFNAVLINTARSEVINEQDLLDFLTTRPDFGYVADVPPTNVESIKSTMGSDKFGKQVFITPKKMGAQTAEANNNAGPAAARQIVDFFEKGDVRFQVNKPGKSF